MVSIVANSMRRTRFPLPEALIRAPSGPYAVRFARPAPTDWLSWVRAVLGFYVGSTPPPQHAAIFEWAWGIRKGSLSRAYVTVEPRGGGKSTRAEAVAVATTARGDREYVLVVSETQEQADKHIQSITAMLASPGVEHHYPAMAERALTKYGHSKGWRRDRIVTASGAVFEGLGLDVAARGIKFEDKRPDLIIFDDVDGRNDTERTTQKKINAITETIIPAGSRDVAVLFVQNLIHADSICTRLTDGRADFLSDRIVSGPHPAIRDLVYDLREAENGEREYVITGGTPTWEGLGVEECQNIIRKAGIRSFLRECQHEVFAPLGALWTTETVNASRVSSVTDITTVIVGVDPSVSNGNESAETGIIVAGLGSNGHIYVIEDYSASGTPAQWSARVAAAVAAHSADYVVAEQNQGGLMVKQTILSACPDVSVKLVSASRGKATRAEPISAMYERGIVHHVGVFPQLERQMTTWVPGDDSPDRMDALVWACTDLMPATRAPLEVLWV